MPADRGRRLVAVSGGVVFVVALGVSIGAQLTLMSILDQRRADEAAREVAESEFTVDLVDDAVRAAISPVIGVELGAEIARQVSTDPRVAEVLRLGLLDAHSAVVDPDGDRATGSEEVAAVLDDLLDEAEARTGADLTDVRSAIDVPRVDPRYVPDAGARAITRQTRWIAASLALIAGSIALVAHPRPGRALAGLGLVTVFVCAAWGVALLVLGWLIGTVAGTLFGQLVGAMWAASSSAMLLVAGAGAVIGLGLWFAGVAIDGLSRRATWS